MSKNDKDTPTQDHPFLGMLCGAISFFMFAAMNAIAKFIADEYDIFETAFYRCFFALIPFLLYGLYKGRGFFKVKRPGVLTLRILVGVVGLVLTFATFLYMPMADATVIFLSSTLITPAVAFLLLGEKSGPHRWAAILVGMVGVFLVAGPTGRVELLGVTIALVAAFTHTGAHVLMRVLREEDPVTISFYFMLGGTILLAPAMFFVANPLDMRGFLFMIGAAATGGFGQLFLALATRYAPVSLVSPFNYTSLVWAMVFDIMIWSIIPGWPVFAGAAIIIGAKLYILHRERLKAKKLQESENVETPI